MISGKVDQKNVEHMLQDIGRRIEDLMVQFNLYFSGELRIPPEKEREGLQNRIRNLMHSGQKTAHLNLLLQNVSSRFSLYNNMWLKRLNEIETGVSTIKRKKTAYLGEPAEPPKSKSKPIDVSLNSEESFEKFYEKYAGLAAKKSMAPPDKENVINTLKTKMITSNVIDAKVALSVDKGKLKIKLKSS